MGDLENRARLIAGITSDGKIVPLKVDQDGNLATGSGAIDISTLAKDGSDITGASIPVGGAGIRGWLSAIYAFITSKLGWNLNNGRLPVDTNFPATQAVSGTVAFSNSSIGISSLPSIPPGGNIIGSVAVYGNVAFSNTSIGVSSLPPLPAGSNAIGSVGVSNFPANQIIGGVTTDQVSASYTRPANTTAYTANQALSNSTTAPSALTFSNASRTNGGSGYITNAWMTTNQTNFAGALRLHLFRGSAAPTAINDGSAYPLLAANNPSRIGYIDFISFSTSGTGSDIAISVASLNRNIPFTTNANTNIYGLIEVRTGFTPTSGQTFNFYLGVEQN